MKTLCDSCIWYEQCLALHEKDGLTTRACEHYDPANDDADHIEYAADLAERQALYNELLEEQQR